MVTPDRGRGLLDLVGVRLTAAEQVVLDRDRELGEVAVADDPAELLFGFAHAGGGPAQSHLALGPVLALRWVRPAVSIIDSHGFVEASVPGRV